MSAHSDDFSMMDDFRDLSQAYCDAVRHGDDREPSPALDAAILAAAHRAVASRPQAVRQSSRFARWRLPLAMAASFLVGVFIVALFVPGEAGPETHVLAQAPQEEVLPIPEQSQPSQVLPSAPAEMDAMVDRRASAPAAVDKNRESETEFSVAARARMEPTILGRSARLSEPSGAMKEERMAEADRAMPMIENAQGAPTESEAVGMGRAKGAIRLSATQEMTTKRQNPQTWLEEIEKLRRDGKIKEARESLIEFRKHYPDHELPRTLRDL